jgi:hypothetical protein
MRQRDWRPGLRRRRDRPVWRCSRARWSGITHLPHDVCRPLVLAHSTHVARQPPQVFSPTAPSLRADAQIEFNDNSPSVLSCASISGGMQLRGGCQARCNGFAFVKENSRSKPAEILGIRVFELPASLGQALSKSTVKFCADEAVKGLIHLRARISHSRQRENGSPSGRHVGLRSDCASEITRWPGSGRDHRRRRGRRA